MNLNFKLKDSDVLETLKYLSSWMKIVVSKCFTKIYFFNWLLVVSCNFNRFPVCFQSFINIACRSTQNAAHIKRFLRLHIVIKPLNKKINTIMLFNIMLKRNSFNIHWKFGTYQKWEPANRIGDFGIFFNGFAKSLRLLWWFWILNECNLSWKIVKYCILSEVCMIKPAPHSTVSPQTWCINSMKYWFTHTQICRQDFVK